MVCLGLEAGAAEWKAQRNPLSYLPLSLTYSEKVIGPSNLFKISLSLFQSNKYLNTLPKSFSLKLFQIIIFEDSITTQIGINY